MPLLLISSKPLVPRWYFEHQVSTNIFHSQSENKMMTNPGGRNVRRNLEISTKKAG